MKKLLVPFISLFLLLSLLFPFHADSGPNRVVRVGAFNYFPAIFKDKDGVVKGFYVDALADIGRRENIRFEYVYGSWSEGLERLQSGEVDLLTSVAYTPERAVDMDYAKIPMLTVWGELYVPLKSEIDGIRGVEGKKIAVVKGDFNALHFIELVKKFDISCQFVELTGFGSVFKAVAAHTVDAGVVNSTFGVAKQQEYGLRSTGIVFNPFDIFFAVAKGKNQELLPLLDRYLNSWRHQHDSVYNSARQKWSHGTTGIMQVVPRWLRNAVVALGALVLLAGTFIILLKKQVSLATEDIRQRERRLRESETNYRVLADSGQALIWTARPDKLCDYFNKVWLDFTGRTFEQEFGNGWAEGVHPDDLERCIAVYTSGFDKRESFSMDYRLRRHDGAYRWLQDDGCPRYDADGNFAGYIGYCLDVTDRKQTEDALQKLSLRQKALLAAIPDIIMEVDPHKVYTWANQAGLDFFGDDVIGKKAEFYFAGEQKTYEKIRPLLNGTENVMYVESRQRRKDGEIRLLAWWCKLLEDEQGTVTGILSSARDITEHKAYEQALQVKNSELERFTYTVSHDLKSPLITIQSFTGQIITDLEAGKTERIAGDLQRIGAVALKMTALLDDLLELSRIGKMLNQIAPLDMNLLVKDVLAQLAGPLEQRQIEIVVQPDLPIVCGDRQRISMVLQNLVENSIKYMGNQVAPRIEIATRPDEAGWIFYIGDNGIGIDPRYHENIFGLFNQLNAKSEGTGIGLALVKRIIETHNGRIWVESEGEGQGARFCFTI